jgi:hypothetical protein
MTAQRKSGDNAWVDPDDAPELDDVFFGTAEIKQGDVVIIAGTPNLDNPNDEI